VDLGSGSSKQMSFREELAKLKREVPSMDDNVLIGFFTFYWEYKAKAWACKMFKSERRFSMLLNVCWTELVKRGYSDMQVA